ncbi:MAG: hypothetical protein EAX96_15645 [Candidatus Lokiarchaeota archaeon]|nr:hypothetical protein [Candidatus Lokiarchaeota archaeon]
MIIEIESEVVEKIKEEIKNLTQEETFKEIGGYLIGLFDGERIKITIFHLDKFSESTQTRIKLSTEAYGEIEEIKKNISNLNLINVGTWHVHPGFNEPFYSQTDLSTLFLEKLRITTDNPVNVDVPLIHVIFNQDLSIFNCFTLNFNANYQSISIDKSKELKTSFIDRTFLNDSIELIKDLDGLINNSENLDDLQIAIQNCEEIEDNMEDLRIQINLLIEYNSLAKLYFDKSKDLEKKIEKFIPINEKIGIIHLDKNMNIQLDNYRPKKINEKYQLKSLMGFFIKLPFNKISEYLERIFLFNFLHKLGNPLNEPFLMIQIFNNSVLPKLFFLQDFEEIYYQKIEVKVI